MIFAPSASQPCAASPINRDHAPPVAPRGRNAKASSALARAAGLALTTMSWLATISGGRPDPAPKSHQFAIGQIRDSRHRGEEDGGIKGDIAKLDRHSGKLPILCADRTGLICLRDKIKRNAALSCLSAKNCTIFNHIAQKEGSASIHIVRHLRSPYHQCHEHSTL